MRLANVLAIVLLPVDECPSMAMVILFCAMISDLYDDNLPQRYCNLSAEQTSSLVFIVDEGFLFIFAA